MSKVSKIKQEIISARSKGDTQLEIRLLANLEKLRGAEPLRPISVEEAYGSMADSP